MIDQRSILAWAAFISMAALYVFGCGGGGGAGSTTTSGGSAGAFALGNGPGISGFYIEFVPVGTQTDPVDPMNLPVGSEWQVIATVYDPAGGRTVLPGTFSLLGAVGGNVTVTAQGRLTIRNRPASVWSVQGRVSTGSGPRTLVQDAFVPAATTRLTGVVRPDGSANGVKFVQIMFFDGTGRTVGGALTGDGGRFTGRVPTTAVSFSIEGATIPRPGTALFYRAMRYRGLYYTVDGNTCPAPLPALGAASTPLPAPVLIPLASSGPPPPPTGCR